jgi:hypothetical protein
MTISNRHAVQTAEDGLNISDKTLINVLNADTLSEKGNQLIYLKNRRICRMNTENRLHQECYIWLHNTLPHLRGLYFEIHNNAFSAVSGARHKAIGRIAGVADNCLLLPFGAGPVFFEFKTEIGKQSEKQKEWQDLVMRNDYMYHVVRSLEEFKKICKYYGLTAKND